MAQYLYAGTRFSPIAGESFAPPAELPAHVRGLNLAELAARSFYPLVDATVVPEGQRRLATFTDAIDLATARQIAGSRGVETATKTIARVYDLETIPPPERFVQADDFVDLFTAAEVKAIRASTNAQVEKWLERLRTRGTRPICISDPAMAAKLDGLIALSLIAPARKAAIVAGAAQG